MEFCFLISDPFEREGDFDGKGVIHYLGNTAGVNMWINPAREPSTGVKVTYCGADGRGDPENILEYFTPKNSSTRSGWCLDLGKYYTLKLTDYTLRQLGSNPKNFLQNFKIRGRLYDDDEWSLLSSQDQVDWRFLDFTHFAGKSCKVKTWSVEKGKELKPHRYFQIVQIRDSMPGAAPISLAGIELYGMLSIPVFD